MKQLATLLCVCALAACGGSGSSTDTGSSNSTPSPNTPSAYTLGGSISGLGGASGLTLSNGTETLAVAANATGFAFSTLLAPGANYSVGIASQPAGLACTVTGGSGTMAGAHVSTVTVQCAPPPSLSLLAGNLSTTDWSSLYSTDRRGITTDSAGNVYVVNSDNTIHKITPAGVESTVAGSDELRLMVPGSTPDGLATDSAGNIYVAADRFVYKITPVGGVSLVRQFDYPRGIAIDSADNMYVTDPYNHVIYKIAPTVSITAPTGLVTTLAGSAGLQGTADGIGADARFLNPVGITTDCTGNVYVSDETDLQSPESPAPSSYPLYGDFIRIRKITPGGVVSTLATIARPPLWYLEYYPGGWDIHYNGHFTAQGIAVDCANNVYVAINGNHTIRKITPGGVVSTLAGVSDQSGFVGGTLPGGLDYPRYLAIRGKTLYLTSKTGIATLNNLP